MESTGLPALERLFTALTNEMVALHEISCTLNIQNRLLDLQILSSFDQNLPKGKWWTSDGRKRCDAVINVRIYSYMAVGGPTNRIAVNGGRSQGMHVKPATCTVKN